MKLVYVNGLGPNYKGHGVYEFIFSKEMNDIQGADWDNVPAQGNPQPPNIDFINKVGELNKIGLNFELAQNSDYFSMYDAIDNVIALAWETLGEENEIDVENRFVFHFGEDLESVENKLYSRDIVLDYSKNLEFKNE